MLFMGDAPSARRAASYLLMMASANVPTASPGFRLIPAAGQGFATKYCS